MAYTLRVEEAAQFASSVPILDAMGVRVLEATSGHAVAELPPEPNVNHFGVTYAGSLYSLAEMLGGVLALATFDLDGELAGFVPLVKESTIRFRRPALGVVRATASLADAEVARVRSDALATGKGEFVLEATLTDAGGEVVGRRGAPGPDPRVRGPRSAPCWASASRRCTRSTASSRELGLRARSHDIVEDQGHLTTRMFHDLARASPRGVARPRISRR
jgi:thioesterase domain-containing protein